jgi:hypothetical protein
MNSTNHATVRRRFLACCSKRFRPAVTLGETGHQVGRELLLPGVVAGRHIVIELPRKRDLVFGGGELLLQVAHVLRRLEVGIPLHHDEQLAQRSGQETFRRCGLLDASAAGHGLRTGVDHRLQRVLLERHRALDGVDEVGDQVVPPLELHVNLLPGVHRLVLEGDEAVVGADHP